MRADAMARALGGRRCGSGWVARCPAHDDRTPSLSIREKGGKILVHCHTGCPQDAVLQELRVRGLWQGLSERSSPHRPQRRDETAHEGARHAQAALRIWQSSRAPTGTAVETYLASRGLTGQIPAAIRFHPGLKHPSGQVTPAMVALVVGGADGRPTAIHRTFLRPDGTGKADVDPVKMCLGPVAGGAVRLGECGEHLALAEGIETALSVQQVTGIPAWAAISASGFRSLVLSPLPRAAFVTIAADPDPVGQAAAYAAAQRWHGEGRSVRIAAPPSGSDFNDLLRAAS
jgi:putative DNA primase/helicase